MGWLIKALLGLAALAAVALVGGYFVLKRADIPYEALASRYETAASRYIDLPSGIHMHYRDQGQTGDGPTILLLHGYSVSLETWEPWVQELSDSYRIITIDLPGHGLTRAPAGYRVSLEAYRDAVAEFAQAYGLTRFAIGGNSMGGHVAWLYALAHPDQLDALILVDSAGWPMNAADAQSEPAFFRLLRDRNVGPLLRDLDNTAMFRKGLQASFANPALATDAMVTRCVEFSRAPGHRDILLQLMLDAPTRTYASAEQLSAIHTPTLILFGGQDHLIDPAHGQQFKDAIPGSELTVFPEGGHILQEEMPQQSAMAAKEFLYRIYEGSALATAAE